MVYYSGQFSDLALFYGSSDVDTANSKRQLILSYVDSTFTICTDADMILVVTICTDAGRYISCYIHSKPTLKCLFYYRLVLYK